MRGSVRLDRALSKLGLASRSDARRLIVSRSVTIDGRLMTDPAHLVIPKRAAITIDRHLARPAWRTMRKKLMLSAKVALLSSSRAERGLAPRRWR